MDASQPRTQFIKRTAAPRTFPCPHCGIRGRRKGTHERTIRDIALGAVVFIKLTVGEYRAKCSCCKTFRAQVPGIEPRAEYTNRVRDIVIDRLLEDEMSMLGVQRSLQREFLLDLSDGFMYDCLDWKVRQIEMADYRQWTLEKFSGTLCVDELHLGHRTLLLATDPLGDFPVAFALVSANDQDHMRRFLDNLRQHGFLPSVVVTDGSTLYPKVLAELWPHARHQLCVFHVIKDVNQCIFDALRDLRRSHAQSEGRKRKRGRPSKAQQRQRARREPSKKDEAYFVWRHRHLIVTRPENLPKKGRANLKKMFSYIPELRTLREFALKVYRLFDPNQTPHQARCRRAALVRTTKFLDDEHLAQALAMLNEDKFEKMIAFLHSPAGQQVRTNNHVERTNRRLRYLEKVRYKWRRRKTIVRFIVLALDRWRKNPRVEPKRKRRKKDPPPSLSAANLAA